MSDSHPLAGLSIVNTRASHQAESLTTALARYGANVLHYPTILIQPPLDPTELDERLAQALSDQFDWLILTSANTVYSLAQRLKKMSRVGVLTTGNLRVAAIGTATAQEAANLLGIQAALIPHEFKAESLAAAIPISSGERVFLPQSKIASPFLANALQSLGASVAQVTAYHTTIGQGGDPVPQLLWEGSIDAVTFTSPSTVHNFIKRLKAVGGSPGMMVDVAIACIGARTAEAARRHDLPAPMIAAEQTAEGLAAALVRHYSR